MVNNIYLMPTSADASWLGSGAVARPRPVTGVCQAAVQGRRGMSGSVTTQVGFPSYEALPVTAAIGARGSDQPAAALLTANLRQTSTTGTTKHLLRHRFRHWSPPN